MWRANELLPIKRSHSFNSLTADESSVATSLPVDLNQESKNNIKQVDKKGPIKITEIYQEYCNTNEEKQTSISSLFAYVYDDHTVPKTFVWLNLPLANLVRSICLSSLLVAITGRPFHQLSVAMIVEAGYLLFIIKSNIKASRFEFYCECSRTALFILYILLKMISLANMTERTRQTVVGRWMSIILLVVIGISISYALFCLISIVIEVSKNLYNKLNKSNATVEQLKKELNPTALEQPQVLSINQPRGTSLPKRIKRVHPRPQATKAQPAVTVSVNTNPVSGKRLKKLAP
jgi:hypothetical protein